MLLRSRLAVVPALLFVVGFCPVGRSTAQEAGIVNRVLNSWHAREERLKSFHVAWQSKDQPRGDIWMDGKRYRVEMTAPPERAWARWWQAFDGVVTRYYYQGRSGDVFVGDPGAERWRLTQFPILLFARPFSGYGFDPSPAKWRVVGENAIIDNQHCVKLETRHGRFNEAETVWADPAREDLIVGWERRQFRGSTTLVTIGYRHDEKQGWLPTRWTETRTRPRMSRPSDETIVVCSTNERLPDAIFAPGFPPETTVLDRQTLERNFISKTGSKTTIAKFDSEETLKIAQALDQTVDFTIDPEPMKLAFEFIAQRYLIKVVIDPAVARAGVDTSMNVRTNDAGIKLKELMLVLLKQAPKPLTYKVENGVLTILPALTKG
jgi:hypothetical protein